MFDFGEDIYEKPPSYFLWPTDGDFTALVDADLLPYFVGFTVEDYKYAKAVRRLEDGTASCLNDTPECDDAKDHVDWLINSWVKKAGADSAILYVTDSASNFRLDVAFTAPYKGQRPEEKPPFFAELKQHLIDMHNAIVAVGCEADDLIVTESSERNRAFESESGFGIGSPEHRKFADCIVVSRDKDLLMCPGWNIDPTTQERRWVDVLGTLEPKYGIFEVNDYRYITRCKFHDDDEEACITSSGESPCEPLLYVKGKNKGKPKTKRIKNGRIEVQRVTKLKGTGLKFFYAQIIMGDTADNYPGLPGKGVTRAFEVLETCNTEEELYNATLQEYLKVYGERCLATNHRGGSLLLTAEQFMAEQGRLAFMQTRAGEIWNPSVELPRGDSEQWNE